MHACLTMYSQIKLGSSCTWHCQCILQLLMSFIFMPHVSSTAFMHDGSPTTDAICKVMGLQDEVPATAPGAAGAAALARPGLAEGTASASVLLQGSGLEAAWGTGGELISHPSVISMGSKAACKAHIRPWDEALVILGFSAGRAPSCARSGSPYASHR